jgi:long-chain acyl-CoA synthetase
MPNFSGRIADAAARWPARPAIELVRSGGAVETTTYTALVEQAGRYAAWLAGAGLGRGDRAAILADNDAQWIAAYLGALRIGVVVVPLDTVYKAAQVRTIADNSGARVLFTTPRYLETAASAAALPGAPLRLAMLSGEAEGLAGPAAIAAAGEPPPMVDAAPDDAAVILYTSGTTADPKGVVLTHANLDAERLAVLSIVPVTEDDAILGVLPLFHALAEMANLLLPLSVGARVVFLETVSSAALVEALQARGITLFACVPQFFYLIHQRVMAEVSRAGVVSRVAFRALLRTNAWLRDRTGWNPARRLLARVHRVLGPSMRILVTGGSRFDPGIGRDLYGMGFTLLNAFGLTETSGAATMQRPGDRFTTSVGHPLPGVEISIKTSGEILLRGPILMREYFNRPDATAEALRDGWLHTGDLGRLDADGRLYITGREKEIIVLSSGKNLFPEEIEAHYRESAFIKELCVLGLARPGEPSAERLHAAVVPDEDALRARGAVNLRELMRFEIENRSVHLPAHKRILSYDLWLEPLPRTTTGKLKRREIERRLRERAAAATIEDHPPTEAEREWLAEPAHAAAVADIAARLHRPAVRPDANLELDLGLDSMERVELLTMLERHHDARVPPAARATIFTVRHLVEAVRSAPALSAKSQTTPESDLAWDTLLAEDPDPTLLENLRRLRTIGPWCGWVLLRLAAVGARIVLRFRATGQAHLPRHGAFLICPNHQSHLDGFLVAAVLPFGVLRRMFFVGAAEHFKSPLMAWIARTANIVPVDPDANLVTAMRAGASGLRLNRVLMIFPEGERSIDGQLRPFRKGAAILSSHVEAPIVPVAIDGAFALWPRGRPFNWRGLLPWRAAPVRVQFGPPIVVPRGDYVAGTARLREAVEGLGGGVRSDGV